MEIPRYIQLDFLMVLIGLALSGISIYVLLNYNEILTNSIPYGLILVLVNLVGGLFLVFGLYEMIKNYVRDNELRDLEAKLERLKLETKLKKKHSTKKK